MKKLRWGPVVMRKEKKRKNQGESDRKLQDGCPFVVDCHRQSLPRCGWIPRFPGDTEWILSCPWELQSSVGFWDFSSRLWEGLGPYLFFGTLACWGRDPRARWAKGNLNTAATRGQQLTAAYVQYHGGPEEGVVFSGAEATGGCLMPYVNAGNQRSVLRRAASALNHWAIAPDLCCTF